MVLGAGCSKPRQPNEVIGDANKALDSLESYSATINMTMSSLSPGAESSPASIVSKIAGRSPVQLLTDTEMTQPVSGGANYSAQYKMLFDGENQWVELSDKQGDAIITPKNILKVSLKDIVTPDNMFDGYYPPYPTGLLVGHDLPATVRTMLKLYSFKSVPAQKVDGIKCEVIEGDLSEAGLEELYKQDNPPTLARGLNITSARLYFDKETHFIKKYEAGSDLKKPEFTAVFNDVKLNKDVSPSLFVYAPPEGVQAKDIKDITLNVMKTKPRLAEKVKELEKQKPSGKKPGEKTPPDKVTPEKETPAPDITPKTDTEAGVAPGKWGIRLIYYENNKMGKHLASRMVAWLNANGVSNVFTRNERIGGVDNVSVYAGPYDTKDAAEKDMPGLQSKRSAFKDCDLVKFK
jgi:outer membrane lipoprotein-sorting protein